MITLPANRQILAGRTHSRAWDAAESGAAITRYEGRRRMLRSSWDRPDVGAAIIGFRRRAVMIDWLCWIISGALVLATIGVAFI